MQSSQTQELLERIRAALTEQLDKVKRGGKARAKALTAKQRSDIARKAAKARWEKK